MMIRYWQPSREIETVRRQLDQVFEQLAGHSGEFNPNWMPAVGAPARLLLGRCRTSGESARVQAYCRNSAFNCHY